MQFVSEVGVAVRLEKFGTGFAMVAAWPLSGPSSLTLQPALNNSRRVDDPTPRILISKASGVGEFQSKERLVTARSLAPPRRSSSLD
jgi:hypothetical protein